MKIGKLLPPPTAKTAFLALKSRLVPNESGCYVLATFELDVAYIGRAVNLKRRMLQHLDNEEKIKEYDFGRAVWFYWLEHDRTERLERTWMNIHLENEGVLPPLNKIYSSL